MPNIFDLSGSVALVTGGNRGIGFGMAEALGKAGADLVIWGSNDRRNDEAAERLQSLPVRVLTQVVDVSDEQRVADAMAEAVTHMGRIDTVIANAGIAAVREPFAQAKTSSYRKVLGVNLDGVFWTLREACKHMMQRTEKGDPGGSLVAVSSLGSIHGMPQMEPYAMAKAALNSLMRSIAVEYGRYGIRANTILPGWIETEMNAGLREEGPTRRILPRIPIRRWGEPADFGGIAVYLASNASAYHTADSFLIDGGYAAF